MAIVLTGYHILNSAAADERLPAVIAIVGSATFLIYNLSIFLVELRTARTTATTRVQWFKRWNYIMYPLLAGALILLLLSLWFVPFSVIIFFAHLGIVSLLYNVPDKYIHQHYRSIRSIPLIKVFLIAYVWAAIGSWLPALMLQIALADAVRLFIVQMLFITAITLPFDIRDYWRDEKNELLTIPGLIGIKQTRWLSIALMVLYTLLMGLWFTATVAATILLCALTILLLTGAHDTRPYWYYTGLIDGLIILQCLFLLLL
ncbi:hypothetical protein [Cesiribacter sp. SM1]|uniref:hypothetical protein n=1 Tax=Cesiribacter sp. SM1 TaxID=2861196 RepID=UPI001CD79FC3|nr:hypothetical protein [Cesiribacter sp. SM1]